MDDDRAATRLAGARIAHLVSEHHRDVYRYAYRLTGSHPDAEDLTQQVFLKAQQKLWQLRKSDSARSWLFAVLRNCYIKNRQRRRLIPAGDLSSKVDTVPEEIPDDADLDAERLQAALDQLPERYRIVLIMFYYEDCSYREISSQLGLPIGTVMSRLARAKKCLRALLLERAARAVAGH